MTTIPLLACLMQLSPDLEFWRWGLGYSALMMMDEDDDDHYDGNPILADSKKIDPIFQGE